MNRTILMTAAALAALTASAAQAATNVATAKMSNFTLTAFDLVAGDAYLPSFEIVAQGANTSGELTRQGVGAIPSNGLPVEQTKKTVDGIFSPLSMSSSSAGQVLQLAVNATGIDLIASGQGNFYILEAKAFASNPASYYETTIRLAPGTGIMASGTLSLSASANCTSDNVYCGAYAGATIRFSSASDPSWQNTNSFSQSVRATDGVETYIGPAGAGYFNYANTYKDVTFSFDASVNAASVVPEPATYGLILAGLITLAVVRRKSA